MQGFKTQRAQRDEDVKKNGISIFSDECDLRSPREAYQNILNPKYFGENSKKIKFNKSKKVVPMLEEINHERDILLA